MYRYDQKRRRVLAPPAVASGDHSLRRSSSEKIRDRVPAWLILAFLLICAAFCIWWTGVILPNQRHRGQSTENNVALARFGSYLIDHQFESLEGAMSAEFDNSTAQPAILQPLQAATSVEVYNGQGMTLAWGSAAPRDPTEVSRIIQHIDASKTDAYVQLNKDGGTFTVWVVSRENGTARGVAIASYRVQVLADWLKPILNGTNRSVYVIDAAERIVLSPQGGLQSWSSFAKDRPDLKALQSSGELDGHDPASGEAALLGYARAGRPGWIVLVSQPIHTVMSPADYLTNLLAVLAFLVILRTGWSWVQRKPVPAEPELGDSGILHRGSSTHLKRDAEPPPVRTPVDARPDARYTPGVIPGQRGLWRCAAVSVRGTSHQKTGQPCQDASYYRVVDKNILVGAVADGAGSAPHGDEGAKVAAKEAVETLAKRVSNLSLTDNEQWNRLLLSAMTVARGNVEASAAGLNKPSRQLATTLILFVAMPEFIAAAQIGDGAIVFQDQEGKVLSLTSPQSGEYINTTTFLVSPEALESVQHKIWRGSYKNIAALTDGLQMLALTIPGGAPHPQFFQPLFALNESAPDPDTVEKELNSFLRSDKVTSRADDDLTVLLASITP